jgi:hypothetical protein
VNLIYVGLINALAFIILVPYIKMVFISSKLKNQMMIGIKKQILRKLEKNKNLLKNNNVGMFLFLLMDIKLQA